MENLEEAHKEEVDGRYEEPSCNVGVMAVDFATARAKLRSICQTFEIDCEDYPVEYFLCDFLGPEIESGNLNKSMSMASHSTHTFT